MKIPVQVWKSIRRIQREFLWGGTRRGKRISWIKWDVVCLPKSKGGLGVRDVRVVNISLLAKWRWRLLNNDNAVWKEVIQSKYGDTAVGRVVLGEECKPWYASLWWKDICSIGNNLNNNWFAQSVVKKLGNGMSTSFWGEVWVGDLALKDRFPRLFSISIQKEATVAALRSDTDIGSWNLLWRRRLFVWEEELLGQLQDLISPVTLSEVGDRWGWIPGNGDVFTVSSTYSLVSNLTVPNLSMPSFSALAFTTIWKSPA
ncbi:putative non-LTR retroelement reverse transcriptase, partial [Trifolium medium]|nr:putative non-LTR retroelement reverse transcriptase [Trifolium medium]